MLALATAVLGAVSGAAAATWRMATMTERQAGRIEELEKRVGTAELTIAALIEKNDERHEANLERFAEIREAQAALPDILMQRIDALLDRRRV